VPEALGAVDESQGSVRVGHLCRRADDAPKPLTPAERNVFSRRRRPAKVRELVLVLVIVVHADFQA